MIAAATIAAACAWDNPGENPYRGTVAAALAAYNIPVRHKAALWVQQAIGHPHAVVTITRDGIEGGPYSAMRDMHWGRSVCRGDVARMAWAPGHAEPALVYCSGSYGIIVPTVCGNVARIDCGEIEPQPRNVQHQEPDFRPGNPLPPYRPHEVPEPGTLALVGAALLAMGVMWGRK